MKEIKDFRKLTREELLKKKKEIKILLMGAHEGVKPLVPSSQAKKLKKSIARINTLLREKK